MGRKGGSQLRADEQKSDMRLCHPGERAGNREAPMTKGWWGRSGSRAAKENVLTRGDPASFLKG